MVREAIPVLHCVESHVAVEDIAACEVKNGEGVLVNWVVLDINSMVGLVLEFANSHIGNAGLRILMPRHCQMISEESLFGQFLYQIIH